MRNISINQISNHWLEKLAGQRIYLFLVVVSRNSFDNIGVAVQEGNADIGIEQVHQLNQSQGYLDRGIGGVLGRFE